VIQPMYAICPGYNSAREMSFLPLGCSVISGFVAIARTQWGEWRGSYNKSPETNPSARAASCGSRCCGSFVKERGQLKGYKRRRKIINSAAYRYESLIPVKRVYNK